MAHFAQLDENNIVKTVIVVNNETLNNEQFPASEPIGVAFCKSLFGEDTNWVQTSYNGSFRYNYAGIGCTYDTILDAFISPKPFNSWILNKETCLWESSVPYPNDGSVYVWDEDNLAWHKIAEEDL